MKYTIEGFSQIYASTLKKEIVRNGKNVTIKVDCTDLVLLRWFVDFYPKMKKYQVNGKEFAWVCHNKMVEDLPLIDINRQAFIERMHKLVEFNILEYCLLKEQGNVSVYAFGENYPYMVEDTRGGKDLICSTVQGVIGLNKQGLCGQTNNDKSIINNNIKDIKKEISYNQEEDALTVWDIVKKELVYRISPSGYKCFIKSCEAQYIKGDILYLKAPSNLISNAVKENYLTVIEDVLKFKKSFVRTVKFL